MSRMPPDLVRLGAAGLLDLLEDVGQHVAEEDRDDRRRRFVRAEAVVVAGAGDAKRSSPWNLLTARSTAAQKTRNWMLSCGVSPGFSRLLPEVVAHAPVEVLAGAVDAGERLLVQQAREAVFGATRRIVSIVIIW